MIEIQILNIIVFKYANTSNSAPSSNHCNIVTLFFSHETSLPLSTEIGR